MNTDSANARIRATAARLIGIASSGLAIFLLWKMILFVRGDVHSWLIDVINRSPVMMHMARSLDEEGATFVGVFFYYVYGTLGYLLTVCLVLFAGPAAARIVERGWAQFRRECEDEARQMTIEAARERRRKRRIKAMQSKANKDGSGDFLWASAAVAFIVWLL